MWNLYFMNLYNYEIFLNEPIVLSMWENAMNSIVYSKNH
jgi:hypothetical protein